MDERKTFDGVCALLPVGLREEVRALCPRKTPEEVRLRVGKPVAVYLAGEKLVGSGHAVTRQDVDHILDRATDHSRYTARDTLAQGYVQAGGAVRIGVCGKVTGGDGERRSFQEISSLSIRIPGSHIGVAEPWLGELMDAGRLRSTLILSPPGGGKTTFLRDLVRLVSTGGERFPPLCVSLVDERGELAAMCDGRPCLDVGGHTDILERCPKAAAVPMLLRAMAPQVLALDELALEEDVSAALAAAGCGVSLLATVHAADVSALGRRRIGQLLLASGVFQKAVVISNHRGQRRYRVEDLP